MRADDPRRDWVDPEIFRAIMSLETDLEPHGFSSHGKDFLVGVFDDVRESVRHELGVRIDRSFGFDRDPEDWYERGEDDWDPEWPEVISDRDVYRYALRRERWLNHVRHDFSRGDMRGIGGGRTIEWISEHE